MRMLTNFISLIFKLVSNLLTNFIIFRICLFSHTNWFHLHTHQTPISLSRPLAARHWESNLVRQGRGVLSLFFARSKDCAQHRGERRILVGIHVFLKISESPSIPHGSTVAIEWAASVLLAHLRINNVQERLLWKQLLIGYLMQADISLRAIGVKANLITWGDGCVKFLRHGFSVFYV